jgi:hypothetical protein
VTVTSTDRRRMSEAKPRAGAVGGGLAGRRRHGGWEWA